ncbi:MAG: retroviral-like aspartic protease family protein, partial [Treponema sp.]|nr:retroviral-like aspartic protease family protein [Treponema sp.]
MRMLSAGMIFFLAILFFSCNDAKEIPFELTGNRVVLNAEINGKSGKFFWDTGTPISLFDSDFSNLDFSRKGTFGWYFFGVREEFDAYYLPEITIGGVRLKTKTEIAKSEVIRDNILEPEGLDGLLGINVFAGYWCEVSFLRKKIILHKEKPPESGKFIPASLGGDSFRLLVDIDGKGAPFMIDTGDPGGICFPPSVILGKLKGEYAKVLVPQRKSAVPEKSWGIYRDIYLVKTNRIALFDDVFEDKTIITDSPIRYDANMATAVGNLGIEFLKNYDLLFDFTNLPYNTSGLYYKRVNTERDKDFFPSEKKVLEVGIYSFYRIPEGITLGIIKGSVLNSEYGITERTVIAKIDGKPVREISDADMWKQDIFKVRQVTVLEDGKERTSVCRIRRESFALPGCDRPPIPRLTNSWSLHTSASALCGVS